MLMIKILTVGMFVWDEQPSLVNLNEYEKGV